MPEPRIPTEVLENYVRAHARWTLAGIEFDGMIRTPAPIVTEYVAARDELRIAAEEVLRPL